MISVKDYQKLQDQLVSQQNDFYVLEESVKKLTTDNLILRQDSKRKDDEIRSLDAMVKYVRNKSKVEDLVEQNLALGEQVASLKQALSERAFIGGITSSEGNEVIETAPAPRDALEGDIVSRLKAAERDLQIVLDKLGVKEMELEDTKEECKAWKKECEDHKIKLARVEGQENHTLATLTQNLQVGRSALSSSSGPKRGEEVVIYGDEKYPSAGETFQGLQTLCAQRAAKWNRCVEELQEKSLILSNTEALLEKMTKAKKSLEADLKEQRQECNFLKHRTAILESRVEQAEQQTEEACAALSDCCANVSALEEMLLAAGAQKRENTVSYRA